MAGQKEKEKREYFGMSRQTCLDLIRWMADSKTPVTVLRNIVRDFYEIGPRRAERMKKFECIPEILILVESGVIEVNPEYRPGDEKTKLRARAKTRAEKE